MNTRLDQSISTGLLVAIMFTALAHGAVEPWSVGIFRLLVIVVLALLVCKAMLDKQLSLTIPALFWPVIGLFALGLVQSLALNDANGQLLTLSHDVEATRLTVTTFFFILAGGLIAASFWQESERLRAVTRTLVIYGLALALFALIQELSWGGSFYWIRPLSWEAPSAFGPFVNHNHFAGYIELLLPLPAGLLITRTVRGPERMLYLFAAALMGVAVIMSLSRGGMISLAAELIFLGGMSVSRARTPDYLEHRTRINRRIALIPSGASAFFSRIGAVGVIVFAIFAGIIWIDAEPVIHRVTKGQVIGTEAARQEETFFSSRGWIWQDTLKMIRANPITGVGLGAFGTVYPAYSRNDQLNVSQAHNDYLQILADGGLIGGGLALWFLILLVRAIRYGCYAGDPFYGGLALGCSAAVIGMLVHSLFDFNLQLPSTSLLFLALTAMLAYLADVEREKIRAVRS